MMLGGLSQNEMVRAVSPCTSFVDREPQNVEQRILNFEMRFTSAVRHSTF